MYKKFSIILVALIAFSCSGDGEEKHEMNNQDATPQVLDNNKTGLGLSSYTKRLSNDLVQQLFEEAVGKDENLKAISIRIENINEMKSDSLEKYHTYIRTNDDYWNSVKTYANQLSDTLLREELRDLITSLEKKYQGRLTAINSTVKQIENREHALHDQEILLKIFVTEPMMNNYQLNEFPHIETLEAVKKSYDSLINEIRPYTKLNK